MKTKHLSLSICLVLGILLYACNQVSPFENSEGELNTEIFIEGTANHDGGHDRFDLSKTDRATINIQFINKSEETLHYLLYSGVATLQKWEGRRWKDLGIWYYLLDVAFRPVELAPGDTLSAPELNLVDIATNMNIMNESGLYRVNFNIYRDDTFEVLIPEADRVSAPFEVILP